MISLYSIFHIDHSVALPLCVLPRGPIQFKVLPVEHLVKRPERLYTENDILTRYHRRWNSFFYYDMKETSANRAGASS